MRKFLNLILISAVILIQPWLWRGDGGILELGRLKRLVASKQSEVAALKHRNSHIYDQISYIKTNPESIEEYARFKLGMIKKAETYYQVVMPIE